MSPGQILEIIQTSKKCPDGLSIVSCAWCLADRLFNYFSSRCYYCHRNKYTREIQINFETHNIIHLVCHLCGNALDGETANYKLCEDLV